MERLSDALLSIAVVALLLHLLLNARFKEKRTLRRTGTPRPCFRDHSIDLERSLEAAVSVNRFHPGQNRLPGVRLDAAIRTTPGEFRAAAAEIAEILGSGHVLSIDLSQMNEHDAARLVDYCHGLAVMTKGWIFRLATRVIVISPGS
ncbi:cell division protein SepF [Micromonospora globbae]|uniref:cell division protein SepF n=1 Tax=Micromonospora globbae TaxID=1894969 RepID=UPI003869363E